MREEKKEAGINRIFCNVNEIANYDIEVIKKVLIEYFVM